MKVDQQVPARRGAGRFRTAVAAGICAAAMGTVAPSAGAIPPVGPGAGDAPQAAVKPVVNCRVATSNGSTVWFGYRNSSIARVNVPVGAANNVAVIFGTSGNHGQVEQFLVGGADYAFGVTISGAQQATWSVTGPGVVDGNLTEQFVTASATGTSSTPLCGPGIGARSASVQTVPGAFPGLSFTPRLEKRVGGVLTQATIRLSLSGLVSACSAGGIPLEPQVLWGFGGPTPLVGGTILRSSGAAYGPVVPERVVRVDTSEFYTFVRTTSPIRPIVDPQQPFAFGTPAQQATGAAPFSRGLSSEMIIADVTGRCLFASGVVRSRVQYWFDADGRPITIMTATDLATQTTRSAVFCQITGQMLTSPCDNEFIGVGPGGPRAR
jgi:hypothetical protein